MYSTIGSGTPSQATCGSSHNLEEVGFEMTISKRLPPEALTARPQNNIMIKIIELNQSIQINKYAITIHASSAAKRLLPFIFYSLSHGCTTKIPSNLGWHLLAAVWDSTQAGEGSGRSQGRLEASIQLASMMFNWTGLKRMTPSVPRRPATWTVLMVQEAAVRALPWSCVLCKHNKASTGSNSGPLDAKWSTLTTTLLASSVAQKIENQEKWNKYAVENVSPIGLACFARHR